jgi:hypothetical protein
MLRKMMIALLATAALGVFAPGAAQARGGFGGGHGGGFGGHGGFGGGGGWHGGGFRGGGGFAAFHGGGGYAFHHGGYGPHFGPGFRHHVFIGAGGFVGPYDGYGYDGYYAYPDDAYYDGGYVESTCYLVRRHVLMHHHWQWHTVQICQ